MKKVLLATALVLAMGFGANAQFVNGGGTDDFFNSWEDVGNGLDRYNDVTGSFSINLPVEHGLPGSQPAPLGSGLIILTALGAGYALRKRIEK